MYKVTYFLTDGSCVSADAVCGEEDIMQFIRETTRIIQIDGVIQVEKQTPAGYPEIIIINAKNITGIKCINIELEDKSVEEAARAKK